MLFWRGFTSPIILLIISQALLPPSIYTAFLLPFDPRKVSSTPSKHYRSSAAFVRHRPPSSAIVRHQILWLQMSSRAKTIDDEDEGHSTAYLTLTVMVCGWVFVRNADIRLLTRIWPVDYFLYTPLPLSIRTNCQHDSVVNGKNSQVAGEPMDWMVLSSLLQCPPSVS